MRGTIIGFMIGVGGLGFEVEAVDEQLSERHLVAAFGFGVDGLAFLGEALEVGGGDLQAVEDGGTGFAVDGALQNGAKDNLDGDLQGVGVLDDGHHEGVSGGVEVQVEVAIVLVAQGGGETGGTVGLGVAAAGSVIEFGNGHGYP